MTSHHPPGSRPTVLLIHGAFAESSSWDGVISELHRRGSPVIAVANPLRGLQQDAAYLRSVLATIPGPVVIAGHSYGGSVMSEAADGLANVIGLVYVASFQLEPGESTAELAAKFPGAQLGAVLEPRVLDDGTDTDLYIKQDQYHSVFAADVEAETAARMAVTQRPITSSALEAAATAAAWRTVPSWSLVTRQDLAIPLESQRFMSNRAGSETVEIDASHAVTVSRPKEVADLIHEAVRAGVEAVAAAP